MTILANAPLIEAIFEIRWGKTHQTDQEIALEFTRDEEDFYPSKFRDEFNRYGFTHLDPLEKNGPFFPHEVRNRYRREPLSWPCYQVGLGILTVNQINNGYDWDVFEKDIMTGIEVLDRVIPNGISSLPILGLQLHYRDGLIFDENDTYLSFLASKTNFKLALPNDLNDKSSYIEGLPKCHFIYHVNLKEPKSKLIIKINDALINAKQGLLIETLIRSSDKLTPEPSFQSIKNWIFSAHEMQRVVFKSIINDEYAEVFK